MARIVGVDLPPNKHVEIGLTYIYGIGRSLGRPSLSAKAGIDRTDPRQGPLRGRGPPDRRVIQDEVHGRGRPAQGGRHEHQAADGDRLLPRGPAPSRPAGARPAHPHQRPHPQGPAARHGGQEEEGHEDVGRRHEDGEGNQVRKEGHSEARAQERPARGVAHIQATFNNTIVTYHRSDRWRPSAGARPAASATRAPARARRTPPSSPPATPPSRPRSTACAPSTWRSRARARARVRHPGARGLRARDQEHQGRHADPAQRVSAAQAAPGLGRLRWHDTRGACVGFAVARG